MLAVLGSLLPLVIALAVAAAEVRSAIRSEVLAGLGRVADVEEAGIGAALDVAVGRLESLQVDGSPLAVAVARPQPDPVELRGELLRVVERSDVLAVAVYDRAGNLLDQHARDGSGAMAASRDELTGALSSVRFGRAYRPPEGAARFQVLLPLSSANEPVGVALVECSLADIVAALTDKENLGRSAESHLVQASADGGAHFISELRFVDNAAFDKVIPPSATNTPAMMALRHGDGVQEGLVDYRQTEVIAAFRSIDRTPWVLVVKVDRDEAFGVSAQLARSLWLTVAAVAVALVATLLVSARSVVRRVKHLTTMAESISRGDLSRRIGRHSSDEFGRLARAFDDMADHLAADVQRRREVEATLQHRARHDELTGLACRVVAHDVLSDCLAAPDRAGVGLLFCDLDSFKTINDELGHSAGDALLQQVSSRLRRAVSGDELVARFGGDEFVVVCRRLTGADDVATVAERIRAAMAAPFSLGGRTLVVTMSIGSVMVEPGAAASAEEVLRNADAAMYRAKSLGRNRHVALDEETRSRASVAFSAVQDLRQALADDALELHYQPIVELRGATVHCIEALLRWPGATGPLHAPAALVALAEESGFAVELDRWVFRTACRQLQRWEAMGHRELCLSVNLSLVGLTDAAMVPFLVDTAAAHHVQPQHLCLELTEMALRQDDATAAAQLRSLRAAGFRIAIDDFGVGYSNLHRLRQLPVDVLKLDRSFLDQIDTDRAARRICASVIQLGVGLGLDVVAEGVEHAAQFQVLAELGCTRAQGYLFAPALDADTVSAFVRRRNQGALIDLRSSGNPARPAVARPHAAGPLAAAPPAGAPAGANAAAPLFAARG